MPAGMPAALPPPSHASSLDEEETIMHPVLEPVRPRDQDRQLTITIPADRRRVSPVDRLALHLGLWLLLRRDRGLPHAAAYTRHTRTRANASARTAREDHAYRTWCERAVR